MFFQRRTRCLSHGILKHTSLFRMTEGRLEMTECQFRMKEERQTRMRYNRL